jgi:hypothetical protein
MPLTLSHQLSRCGMLKKEVYAGYGPTFFSKKLKKVKHFWPLPKRDSVDYRMNSYHNTSKHSFYCSIHCLELKQLRFFSYVRPSWYTGMCCVSHRMQLTGAEWFVKSKNVTSFFNSLFWESELYSKLNTNVMKSYCWNIIFYVYRI